MLPERLVVGRIVKPHGIHGEVVVEALSDSPDRFAEGSRLLLGGSVLTVEAARAHAGRLLVRFVEVSERTAAEALRGGELEIRAAEAQPLREGSYYPFQLEGLAVAHVDGRRVGTLVRVEPGPAHDLWVVDAGGREVLVPAVHQIVRSVDLDAGLIEVDPPEGLF